MKLLIIAMLLAVLHPFPEQANKPDASQNSAQPAPKTATVDQAPPARPSSPHKQDGANGKANEPSWCERLLKPLVDNWPLVIVAIVGIVVAIATLSHMRESSERQLQAYVLPEGAAIVDGTMVNPVQPAKANVPGVAMLIKNFGQTPAYKVVSFAQIAAQSQMRTPSWSLPPYRKCFLIRLGREALLARVCGLIVRSPLMKYPMFSTGCRQFICTAGLNIRMLSRNRASAISGFATLGSSRPLKT